MYRTKIGSGHKNSKITLGRSCARHGRRADAKETLVCNNLCKKEKYEDKNQDGWRLLLEIQKKTAGNDVLEKSFRLRSVEKTSWKPIQLIICSLDDDDDNYDYK